MIGEQSKGAELANKLQEKITELRRNADTYVDSDASFPIQSKKPAPISAARGGWKSPPLSMNDGDQNKPSCINWCKNTPKISLRKLRLKPDRGCPTLSKTNSMHFLSVAFWPMGSYACVVPTAPMRNWWLFPASGVDFVPHAVGGAWRRRLLTWLITSFPGCRCANGCSHCRSHCVPVSCPSALAHIDIASHTPCHLNFSDQGGRIETIRSTDRCDYNLFSALVRWLILISFFILLAAQAVGLN